MLFCTLQDLIDDLSERVLVQLTDDAAPPTAINETRCQAVIAQASEVIEGRLAGRFTDTSQLQPTPLLKRIALDICAYYLYSRRNKGDIDNVRKRYEASIRELEFIKLGQITPPSQIAANPQEYITNKGRNSRTFSSEVWERF